MKAARVLSIASTIHTLIVTCGFTDVSSALPSGLDTECIDVRTVAPGCPSCMTSIGPVAGVRHLPELFDVHGVEYHGQIGFLKAGLYFADRITTISPTYAREILRDEGAMGLGGLLRERACDLSGILNGVDTSFWDPATDPHIPGCFDADMPSHFEADVLKNRATNKAALQRRLGL